MGQDAESWRALCAFASDPHSAEDPREPWEIVTTPRPKAAVIQNGSLLKPPQQAAAILQITVDQLFEFVRLGELRYVNVGRGDKKPRYRFSDADLSEFINKRKEQGIGCQSSKPKSQRRTTGSTSSSKVIGFMARRNARLAKKPKG